MSHHEHTASADLSANSTTLAGSAGSLQMALGAMGVIGIGAAAFVGWNGMMGANEEMFWRSYLQNFLFILTIALGGLFFVFVQHLTRAGWSVAVRRPAEVLASNLRWMWILFVVPFGVLWMRGKADILWPWANLEGLRAVAPAEADLVSHKLGYLNANFFWVRAASYFVLWALFSHYFLAASARVGQSGDPRESSVMQKVAAPTAILFALTITFAAFDWIMSLSPAWFSTMFGVYFFAGCATSGFAALIIVCTRLQAAGYLRGVITAEHYQDLGKLLFAFGMVFWAYIAYSQYMLIWYANIPEETGWFLARQAGDWAYLSLALLFGHFLVPFVGLISKWPKRMRGVLTLAAIWMLAFAWIDLYWLVIPTVPHDLGTFNTYAEFLAVHGKTTTNIAHPINYLMLAGMVGLFGAMTVAGLRRLPLVCAKDPRIHESLGFQNM